MNLGGEHNSIPNKSLWKKHIFFGVMDLTVRQARNGKGHKQGTVVGTAQTILLLILCLLRWFEISL